jgi:Legume lectin domain.
MPCCVRKGKCGHAYVGFTGGSGSAVEIRDILSWSFTPFRTENSGDIDINGCVDDAYLLAVLFAFGSTGSYLGRVDVNCDGIVDDADLLIVLFNFGSGC